MNRLCVYFFYDKDGVVDDYVPYFLSAIKPLCKELCVVVNGMLSNEGKQKLEQCTKTILVRENKGYDSWAYKYALEHYGFEKIKEYDELILCNFTFFGPIFPLSEMFLEMEKRDCDFWGIHRHPAINSYMSGTRIIEHIQSHFIVFNKAILKNKSFKEYWDTLQPISNYEEAVAFHELRCTRYFEDIGFVSSSYINKEKYFNLLEGNSSIFLAAKQIIEDRCPILKRKVYEVQDNIFKYIQHDNYTLFDLRQFIVNNSDYVFNFIVTNINRCFDYKLKCRNIKLLVWYIKSKILLSKRKRTKYDKKFKSYKELKYFESFRPKN